MFARGDICLCQVYVTTLEDKAKNQNDAFNEHPEMVYKVKCCMVINLCYNVYIVTIYFIKYIYIFL